MSTVIFKTTLLRSNPQVVRQFQISDSRPISDLLICVCLIHGWEPLTDTDIEITTPDQETLALNGTIRSALSLSQIGQYWYIRSSMRNPLGHPNGENWLFRLNYLGINKLTEKMKKASEYGQPEIEAQASEYGQPEIEAQASAYGQPEIEAQVTTTGQQSDGSAAAEAALEAATLQDTCGITEDLEPWLLRCRGQNPLYNSLTMRTWNNMHQEMLSNGECYSYSSGYILAENYMPDINSINVALDRRIVHGIIDVKIDYSRGTELSVILNSVALNDLKQMARDMRISIDTNLRKYDFIQQLVKIFDQDKSWNTIVGAMELEEYESFRRVCLGTSEETRLDMPILRDYCLIHSEYSSYVNDIIPIELIRYFGKLTSEGAETEIYKDKRIRKVLEACRRLYLVFSKKQAKNIAEIMFPDDISDEDFEAAWGNRRSFLLLNPEVMYSTINLEEKKAKELYDYLEEENIPYHTPEKEELFEIAVNGFHFSESTQTKLLEAIRKVQLGFYRTFYNQEEIADLIYELYHLGWGKAAIENQLRKKYSINGSRKDIDAMFRIVDAASNDIRLVSLRSNTRREYSRLVDFRRRQEARRKKE